MKDQVQPRTFAVVYGVVVSTQGAQDYDFK